MTPIRVGIVENHPLYRRGLIELLAEETDIIVLWTATTVPQMHDRIETGDGTPDVVLLDRNLPDGGPQGTEAVAAVVALGVRVLVISATDAALAVAEAMRAGASGYLSKDAPEEELAIAIRTIVQDGGQHVSPLLAGGLVGTPTLPGKLSFREAEVTRLIARGDSDADIGQQLGIKVKTVQSHLDRIHAKTGIRDRRKLARWALSVGLVELDRQQPT